MQDLIKLLPDSVSNQIAAGEVVQRPASAVKELMENSVDAGATEIRLIVREAGKSLIQVIDNGCGMSERDARMCFERHATSKISTANDLLSIRTLGFRGEALASVASIAQIELKTKRTEDEIGTQINVEGSEFRGQSPVTSQAGTSIAVKNIFFNVPARRNFLKSNTLELKYIIEEFFRVSLVNPEISFVFHNNDKLLYRLAPGNLKQRIVGLFGNPYQERLIPVEQESSIVNVKGFIGKPDFAKKTRGEQYFFTNGRYIRNPYLHHAVENAFAELIPRDSFPTYFLYLTVDPGTIDVNIHPTKTEINFQDIRSIYAIIHSSVRQSIGKFNITPSLDFETEQGMNIPPVPKDGHIRPPTITIDPSYNPFEKKARSQTEIPLSSKKTGPDSDWRPLYEPLKEIHFPAGPADSPGSGREEKAAEKVVPSGPGPRFIQFRKKYLFTETRRGVVIIDIEKARERILYEKFFRREQQEPVASQRILLPQTLAVTPEDSAILAEYNGEISQLGFDVSHFGKNSWIIQAVPAGIPEAGAPDLIESLLESLKSNPIDPGLDSRKEIAICLAKSMAGKEKERILLPEEMNALIEQLFSCAVPDITPDGKPVMYLIGDEELGKRFK